MKYRDGHKVAVINWEVADIRQALENLDIPPTDENVDKIIMSRLPKSIVEQSIEYGWEILEDGIRKMF